MKKIKIKAFKIIEAEKSWEEDKRVDLTLEGTIIERRDLGWTNFVKKVVAREGTITLVPMWAEFEKITFKTTTGEIYKLSHVVERRIKDKKKMKDEYKITE